MLNTNDSIVLGVVSGVITSFVIWVTINIFKKIIVPWYQSIIYQGVKINGTWVGFHGSNTSRKTEDADMEVYIEQKGSKVTGEILITKNVTREQESKILSFEGGIKDANLVLTYQAKDQSRLGLGSYVMKLENDGRDLRGKCLYISSNKGNVAETELLWKRKVNA